MHVQPPVAQGAAASAVTQSAGSVVPAGADDAAKNMPAAVSFAGDWVGNVFGTNTGKVYAKIAQQGQIVSGEARLMDDSAGLIVFDIIGTADEHLIATLVPRPVPEGIEIAPGNVELELADDGRLHGRWSMETGTGGVVTLSRFTLPSEIKGPSQPLTPLRIFNDSEKIGAVRINKDGIRRVIDAVQQDFATRAVAHVRPKGGKRMTAHADDLLANSHPGDVLDSLTISIQETEPTGINRGVSVDLAESGESEVRAYGTSEVWVTGKTRLVAAAVRRHERRVITSFKRYGLDINGAIFLLAIAFLPNANAWLRVAYLTGVILILVGFRHVHAKLIPLTEVVLGSGEPSAWSRIGAPASSWLLGIGSAVLVKLLADLLSDSSALNQVWVWLANLVGGA